MLPVKVIVCIVFFVIFVGVVSLVCLNKLTQWHLQKLLREDKRLLSKRRKKRSPSTVAIVVDYEHGS